MSRGEHRAVSTSRAGKRDAERASPPAKEATAAARAAQLRHVHDRQSGIKRIAAGRGWRYVQGKRTVRDKTTLARIRALAIPPAWTNVWICALAEGHLQATGRDAKGRKQYRYHPRWAAVRGQLKFDRLHAFGKQLPRLRRKVVHDLRKKGLPKEKVLAGAIALMEHSPIRVGNRTYTRENGSFGLSTLRNKHVQQDRRGVRLRFRGKSGKVHDLPVTGRRLARLVLRCKELPGQDLFTYVDEEGVAHDVDSGMVNAYIREASGGDFSSKDLRTWMGSVRCVDTLLGMDVADTEAACTRCINEALDAVAEHLGNTRAVCKAHYVHPGVLGAFRTGRLAPLAEGVRASRSGTGLGRAERLLMKVIADKPAR